MKKFIALFIAIVLFAACSKDDNKDNHDPVFSQPYTELQSLSELVYGKYQYIGNKIGDRKVGIVNEGTYCKQLDYLLIATDSLDVNAKLITYNNFRLEKPNNVLTCVSIFDFPRKVIKFDLKSPGILKCNVEDDYWDSEEKRDEDGNVVRDENGDIVYVDVIKRKTHYSGDLEIGFQAGYLRIEDRLSDYKRVKDEKVYLYFKKI